MKTSKKTIGNIIRTIRKHRGYTIEELAHLCGLHSTHIGKIERGEISPSVESLEKITSVLNLTLVEFFMMIPHNSETIDSDVVGVLIQKKIGAMANVEKEKLLQFLELYHP